MQKLHDLLGTHGLENHVSFATYISDLLLYPVNTEFQLSRVMYGAVGSVRCSNDFAVLSTIQLEGTYDKG